MIIEKSIKPKEVLWLLKEKKLKEKQLREKLLKEKKQLKLKEKLQNVDARKNNNFQSVN